MQSKKFIVAIVAAIGIVLNDVFGKPVGEETIYAALGILGAYIVGQGIADHGAQGAANAAERSVGKGIVIAAAVRSALGGEDVKPTADEKKELVE